ncbi:MAG: NADH-quinone oxidoreductase subunit C [Propionibacteriaceae bacterium]
MTASRPLNADRSVGSPAGTTVESWHAAVVDLIAGGERFAGMYGTEVPDGCRVTALLAGPDGFDAVHSLVVPDAQGRLSYPSLTPAVPSAFWYERAAHDLSGLVPLGHPRLDPLLLSLEAGNDPPRPGGAVVSGMTTALKSNTPDGPVDVHGRGMFTLSLGPVRSGVFESIEFLIETPGEDIPHLNIRPHYKHRGVAKRFEGLSVDDAVLVAERVEGIASVAHALAFSHAAERICATTVSPRAQLWRVVYAELERIANHLDVAMRLTEAAGLAVATSRFGWHKEEVMRLMSRLCGSRFGRSVVVPGGIRVEPRMPPRDAAEQLTAVHRRIDADAALAMNTPSFLDRLRGTGPLEHEHAAAWGALGPIGRASGVADDNRWTRPGDAYRALCRTLAPASSDGGDVMARLRVRWGEIDTAVQLAVAALTAVDRAPGPPRLPVELPAGPAFGIGWAEAPQGEVLYAVELQEARIFRCFARSASLHNLVLFHELFHGDVLTDFAFNEASFGLGYAGVAM